jgi:hypothetical protein
VQEKACQGLPDEGGQYLARYGEHGNRGPDGDDRILMLQEVLYMREWIAILARRAGRRESRKSPLCQLQAATIDRGDTTIAYERGQMLGEVFTQPTSRCGNGWCVGPRSSLPRQESLECRLQQVPSRHDDSISRERILYTLERQFRAKCWAIARRTREDGLQLLPLNCSFQTDSTKEFPKC